MIPKLRSPVVLVHGLFGFDRLRLAGATLASYFSGVPELMHESGNLVLLPVLTPTGGVEERAKQLKDFILNHTSEPVHLIAHSLGGLDARYMISRLGMADKVLTLTTLGTPHRGTCFADWGISRFARLLSPLLDMFGLPYQAFFDLTRKRCKAFNETVIDAPNVRYFSIAGKHDGHFLHLEWMMSHKMVLQMEGDNDGIVSVQSASYGEHCEEWESDHFGLVNWYHPLKHYRGVLPDPAERYGAILRRLADLGY